MNQIKNRKLMMTFVIVSLTILFFSCNLLTWHSGKVRVKNSSIQLKRQIDNHFRIKGKINQIPVIFLLDTGAGTICMSPLIAKMANLKKIDSINLSTANGIVTGYTVFIKQIKLGDIYIKNIKGVVSPGMTDHEVLLGQNITKFFEMRQIGDTISFNIHE